MSAAPAGGTAEIQLAPGVRGITAFALALGTFMQVLDSTIANVSLPTIAGSLGVSPHQGVWVITSFGVANGVSVPLTGWLMQRYGIVRTFATCVLLFTAASFLCGIAWSFESLIAFRVLQGAVSGPLIPGSQALLLAIFPYAKRGTALGIWSMTTLVAPVLGPILGGYISAEFSWPWIFLMNVPVGLLSASVCWTNMRRHELPTRKVPVDRIGLVLLVIWIGALQVMLDTGKDADWFASTRIVVLGLVALVGFVAFLIWELTERNPIVDLTLFWRRNFGVGVMVTCLAYGLFFANVVILPLWLQTQLGYTSTWAGLVIAPAGIAALICTPFVGRSVGRVDPRIVASIAFLAFGASYYLRAQLNSQAAFSDFVLPLAVQGVGMAAFFVPMVSIMLDGLPVTRIPSATGISNFARITAGAFSASVITSVWDDRAALHQSQLADASSLYDPVAQQAMGTAQALGFTDSEAVGALTRGLVEQAYMLASLDIFWVSAWIPCVLFGLIWLTRRPTGAAPPTVSD